MEETPTVIEYILALLFLFSIFFMWIYVIFS